MALLAGYPPFAGTLIFTEKPKTFIIPYAFLEEKAVGSGLPA